MKKIDVNKEDVLKIGVEMLTSGSVKNLTLRELSNKTGVSVGTLYNFFGDKEQLQREVLGYFWKTTMLQEGALHVADIDFISHIEHAYGLFLTNFQKIHGAMSKNTSKASSNCDILSAFPMMHISKRIESWVEKLMDFHKDELKVVELRCTKAETVNFIVAVFMGSFIQGAESLGIAPKALRAYLMQ